MLTGLDLTTDANSLHVSLYLLFAFSVSFMHLPVSLPSAFFLMLLSVCLFSSVFICLSYFPPLSYLIVL